MTVRDSLRRTRRRGSPVSQSCQRSKNSSSSQIIPGILHATCEARVSESAALIANWEKICALDAILVHPHDVERTNAIGRYSDNFFQVSNRLQYTRNIIYPSNIYIRICCLYCQVVKIWGGGVLDVSKQYCEVLCTLNMP